MLKTKSPLYEIEITYSARTHSRNAAGNYTVWELEIRRIWPNEEGIFEPPVRSKPSRYGRELIPFLKEFADITDDFTSFVCMCVELDIDPDKHDKLLLRASWSGEDLLNKK